MDAGTDNQWTLGELAPGDSGTLTIQAQVGTPADGTLLTTTLAIESDQGTASTEETTTTVNGGVGLNLSRPLPGTAGQYNILTTLTEASDTSTLFYVGVGEGSTPVPDCPGANFDMAQAWLIGYAAVNAEGESSHGFQVPENWRGYPLRFQVRGDPTCGVSNLVEHMFQ